MGFFAKTKKIPGWMAFGFQVDGICAVHIRRSPSALPVVELAAFSPADKPVSAGPLDRFGKDLHANRYDCTTLLDAGEYQLLSVDAPTVPQEELKTAIRWRLKDMLDFHINDAVIDVLDVPVEKNAPARAHSMFAVAARNKVIEQRQGLFEETKIPLSVIDIPELAQRNISALLEPEGRGVALLSFGPTGGLLTVTFAGELYLSRRIDLTLAQLVQSDAAQKNACFERVTLELQRSLDHCDRQYHFITLSKLVLSPMGPDGGDLKAHLAANMYLPVEIMDLESVLDISRVPELKTVESQQRYFMTLGAALRYEEKAL